MGENRPKDSEIRENKKVDGLRYGRKLDKRLSEKQNQ